MSRLLIALLLLAAAPQDDGAKAIFDGKTLAGWVPRGGGKWSVDDGCILGETGTGAYGWLCSEKKYGDFDLQFEAKLEGLGNSGVQVRSAIDDKDLMVGYQFDLDRTRPSSGRLYDEARRLLLMDVPQDPAARSALKAEEWNSVRLSCIGDQLRSWVNGVAIVDYVDSVDLEGILALQVHSGKTPVKVRFRNLKIKDLGHRKWKPLSGWERKGTGISVEEAAITVRRAAADAEPASLSMMLSSADFTLRLSYKVQPGNALSFGYGSGGDCSLKVQAERLPKPYVDGEWNRLKISAHGDRIVVQANDLVVAEAKDAPKRNGRFGLDLPGGKDLSLQIKDLQILGDPER